MGDRVEVRLEVRVVDLPTASGRSGDRLHLVDRLVGVPPRTEPEEQSRKSASKIGSSTSSAAVCTTRSRTVGMPSGRSRPSGLGMYTRRTGCGR